MELVKELFDRLNTVRPLGAQYVHTDENIDFSSTDWIVEVAYTNSPIYLFYHNMCSLGSWSDGRDYYKCIPCSIFR
jgi:hypothetical protein